MGVAAPGGPPPRAAPTRQTAAGLDADRCPLPRSPAAEVSLGDDHIAPPHAVDEFWVGILHAVFGQLRRIRGIAVAGGGGGGGVCVFARISGDAAQPPPP